MVNKRQIFLFVTAILLPAAVLIGLGIRLILQERELAGKRVADQRRDALEQVRRELSARLEAIKFQEINRLIRPDPHGAQAVALLARIEGERLVLPWEAAPQPRAAVSEGFAEHRQQGEQQEFVKKDFRAAADAYRQALGAARPGAESAEARLLLARSLAKTGSREEALRHYRALLEEDGADENGVAFRFYAAERLLALNQPEAVLAFLLEDGAQAFQLSELYVIRSMLESIPESGSALHAPRSPAGSRNWSRLPLSPKSSPGYAHRSMRAPPGSLMAKSLC